jgi:putative transposase
MGYSDERIEAVLSELREGARVADVCKRHGVSAATVHRWRARARACEAPPEGHRPYQVLAEENRRLKHLVGELMLENRELRAGLRRPGAAAR